MVFNVWVKVPGCSSLSQFETSWSFQDFYMYLPLNIDYRKLKKSQYRPEWKSLRIYQYMNWNKRFTYSRRKLWSVCSQSEGRHSLRCINKRPCPILRSVWFPASRLSTPILKMISDTLARQAILALLFSLSDVAE